MDKREKSIFAFLIILIIISFCLSLMVGKYPISLEDIKALFFNEEISDIKKDVFWNLRFSRTLMVLLSGIGLSLAGSVFQTIFRNPLASPDIIGVTSGANLGAAVAIVIFGSTTLLLAINSFLGGLMVIAILTLLIKITGSKNTTNYILIGIIIKSLAEAAVMALKYFADPEKELATIEYWAMGSFSNITMSKLLTILPFYLVGILGIVIFRRQIYILSLSDEESSTLGVNVQLLRITILSFATLLVSSIICITGLVKFVGLISPHIARLILKKNNFKTAIFSSLIGGIILLISDCLVRSVHYSVIPISIITTIVATPFLLLYLIREKGRI